MRIIPPKLKKSLLKDSFMKICIHPDCNNQPEWEHCWIYAGKQINEVWAIVPCCYYHHRGGGLNKDFNKWVSINLANNDDLTVYNKKDWESERIRLNDKYPDFKKFIKQHMLKCLTS